MFVSESETNCAAGSVTSLLETGYPMCMRSEHISSSLVIHLSGSVDVDLSFEMAKSSFNSTGVAPVDGLNFLLTYSMRVLCLLLGDLLW